MSPEPKAPQYRRSLLAAALVTVISVPLLFAIAMGLVDYGASGQAGGESFFRALGVIVLVGVPLTAATVLLIGLPVVLKLRALQMLNAQRVCGIATVIGALVLAGAFGVFGTWSVLPVVMGAVTGAAGGLIFCLMAGIRFGSTAV